MVRRVAWARDGTPWRGEFQGAVLGSEVSIIFSSLDRAGEGPKLHRHPYSETFIIRRGTVIFSDGIGSFEASAGEIVVVPAGAPHRFISKSDHVEMINIHSNSTFVTEWLEKVKSSPALAGAKVAGTPPSEGAPAMPILE